MSTKLTAHDKKDLPAEDKLPDATRRRREHFLPIRKPDLVRLILSDERLATNEIADLNSICHRLDALIHLRFHRLLSQLKAAYAPCDPDADTRNLTDWSEVERVQMREHFFDSFGELARNANYLLLAQEQIESLAGIASDWGLRLDVDFSIFARLEVYARGDIMGQKSRRNWRNWFRVEQVDVPTHERLIVCFHLCDHPRMDETCNSQSIYLKMFKNIPKLDVDMLLPGTRAKMTLFDKGKIWFPTLSGLVLAFVRFAKVGALIVSGTLWGIFGFLAIIGGTIGYGIKSFFGYLQTQNKYQLNLTRNLYFQNLDNNAGVVHRLLDEAESQEFREAILAYYLLWRNAPKEGWTLQQLDEDAEAYLLEKIDLDVDFEADDAVRKLLQIGLAEQCHDQLIPVTLSTALERLAECWQFEWTIRGEDADER